MIIQPTHLFIRHTLTNVINFIARGQIFCNESESKGGI